MKFGFILPNFGDRIGPGELVEISKACEEEGFDSVWATDHIIMPVELREPYGQVLEPLVTISFVAAATRRLKVGTSILVLPQRNPILVAKQAATIDAFSGGRLILGFGAGWAEKEFGFLGADFKRRGRMMDESVRLIKKLWSDDMVSFEGEFFHVKDALFLPKPAHGNVPIWIAGNSRSAIERAIRLGDGWHPVGLDLKSYAAGAEMIRQSGKRLTLSMRMTTDLRKKREDSVAPSGERRTYFSGGAAEVRRSIDDYSRAGLEYPCIAILHPSAIEIMEDVRKFGRDVIRSYG
ncbi:MAG: LLM class F420-dependent oxidoreductase [Nitrososphaerales archaeon]|nr:LLM class F420-dependent oxidoreductase [Nitrososphaerales archaeon]